MPVTQTNKELLQQAKEADKTSGYKSVIESYKAAIKLQPYDLFAYRRLIIVYRKQKMYKEELKVIEDAIKSLQSVYNNKKTKFKSNSSIYKLSNALMKSTGLIDKKGNSTYEPEPITALKKRKQTVMKRLAKNKIKG